MTNGVLNDGQPNGKYLNPIDYILDADISTILYTYGVEGATDLVLSIPGLDAGQQVEIYYQRGNNSTFDIEFNGNAIGAIANDTKQWSNPLTAIAETNVITLRRNNTPGSSTAVAIGAIKVDGEFYDGKTTSINDLTDLTDVQTSGTGHDPANGDALVWNESHGHWMPGEVSSASTFSGLTDTPSTLDAGSYLRVNLAGDGVEQIKTAPPTGGLGDNSIIQSVSTFDRKLPDAIVHQQNGKQFVLRLAYADNDQFVYRNEDHGSVDRKVYFNNPEGTVNSSFTEYFTGVLTLQEYIDSGRAIYYGSGGGGGGSVNDISGLIRHYNLDGNLNDATLTTDLTSTGDALNWEAGKFNQAVKLNGTNNKLRTGLVIPSDSTISLWYKHNDKTGGNNLYIFGDFASSGVNTTSSVSLRLIPTNEIQVLTSGGVQFESPSSHSAWHHAVLTRSYGAWKFYLDGTEVHSGTAASASNALVFAYWTTANLSSADPNFFGGWLDNIRIYNRELSASEVTTLYNQ